MLERKQVTTIYAFLYLLFEIFFQDSHLKFYSINLLHLEINASELYTDQLKSFDKVLMFTDLKKVSFHKALHIR
jgi:hypothetical protein